MFFPFPQSYMHANFSEIIMPSVLYNCVLYYSNQENGIEIKK